MNNVEIVILCVIALTILAVACDSNAQGGGAADQSISVTYVLGWVFLAAGFIGLESQSGDLKDVSLYVLGLGILFVCGISLLDRLSGKKPMVSCWSCDNNVVGDLEGVVVAGIILLFVPTMLSRHGYFERFFVPAHAAQKVRSMPVNQNTNAGSARHKTTRVNSAHNGQNNEHSHSRTIQSTAKPHRAAAR